MTHIPIPLFPLGTVLYPEGVLPLQIFEVRYLDMIHKCIAEGMPFGVVMLIEGREVRTPASIEKFSDGGTLASVAASHAPSPGLIQVVCRGGARFKVVSSQRRPNGLWVGQVELVAADLRVKIPSELRGAADALERVLESLNDVPEERWPVKRPFRFDDCGWVANRWCELLPLPLSQKHGMLMLDNPLIRLELMHDLLDEHGLITS
ncbi:LON peptidase substrate-binding domain-containing protein [Massilia sp. R2A-15]|uniref:LON peptidase substrate-binding domain-containing protein n=1 Tax=Massilia sp. R2A-15 TaxID=3064278 RepID=UPI002734EBC1|nr:LON peptidase substrate-binding domain-containing protein [Massilia sp. R2A-15]WLI88282.1 LON peptidase substrate-binding domain-containing protein [Massilia sp. R2A-15]